MPVRSDVEVREILGLERVAVVGCSRMSGKDAHEVPKYLVEKGYDVVPVNPNAEEIFGLDVHDTLADVPGPIDIVDVFRPSDEVAGIVDEVLERGDVKVVWTQLGIRDDDAAAKAEEAGMRVVQDRCIRTEHQRLVG